MVAVAETSIRELLELDARASAYADAAANDATYSARRTSSESGTYVGAAANGAAYPGRCCSAVEVAQGLTLYEEFHPYGTTSYRAADSGIEVSPKRYRYVGKERDEETGLDHMGARYYASWLGRWTAADPIGLGDGVNRYAYVRGNPVGLVDPSGTLTQDPQPVEQQPKPVLETKRELSEAEQKKLRESEVSFGHVEVRTESGLPKSQRGIVAEAVHAKFSGYAKAEDFSLDAVRGELQEISEIGNIPTEGSVEVKLRGNEALRLAKRFEVSAGDTERLFPSLAPLIPGSGLIDAPAEVKQAAEVTLVLGTLYGAYKVGRALYQAAREKIAQRAAVREAAKETTKETAEQAGAKAGGQTAAAVEKGLVREGGDLQEVLQNIEGEFAKGTPKSASEALSIVERATSAAKLEPGVAELAADGSIILTNKGGITTTLTKSGEIIVQRGKQILIRLTP